MKNKIMFIILGLTVALLAPLTAFNLLDVFYFPHTQGLVNDDSGVFFDEEEGETKVEYICDKRNVEGIDVKYHLLKIHLNSLNRLKSRLAVDEEGHYGINVTQKFSDVVSDIKEETGLGVLGAITGDFAFWSSSRKGYVVRNGVVYRTERKSKNSIDLVVKKDRTISFMKEGDFRMDVGVGQVSKLYYQIISFGPVLLEDGKIVIDEDAEINGNTWVNNQRAAIGFVDAYNLMFLATEANDRVSKTLQSFKLHELAVFLKEQGCVGAYNLDGGYSAGLAFNDKVVFSPSRTIGDVFYIST